MKIEPAFGVFWVSVGSPLTPYSEDKAGGYARRTDVEEIQEKAARLWRAIDLMRRADDIETARAIAQVIIGPAASQNTLTNLLPDLYAAADTVGREKIKGA